MDRQRLLRRGAPRNDRPLSLRAERSNLTVPGATAGLSNRVNEQLAITRTACKNNPMGAITFDTLKFTKRLKEAGFTEPQAEAIADSFLQATGEAEVATKRDIERLEARLVVMEAKIVGVEGKVMGELALVKWMLGVLLGGVLALVLKTFFPS